METEQARSSVNDGMSVRSSDGAEVGRVMGGDEDGFIIERGVFFTDDFYCRYDEVADVDEGAVTLVMTVDQLSDLSEDLQPSPGTGDAGTPPAAGN
jgi:hypothetical protein